VTGASHWLVIIILLAVCGVFSDVSLGQTLSPRKVLGRYQQQVWQDQHGLPQNGVHAITRTRDGYLWLGTVEGAARFDGVRFTVFDSNNTPEFRSNQIVAFLEDRVGDLWLGTNGGGLVRRTKDGFRLYTTQDGLADNFVSSLAEDDEGNVWIGTGAGLNRFRAGQFDVFSTREGLPSDGVQALATDGRGGLWIGTNRGVVFFKDARFTAYTGQQGPPNGAVSALCLDRAGRLWVGTLGGGLSRFEDGRFIDSGLGRAQVRIYTLYEDREGRLWVGTDGGGLALLKDGKVSYYSAAEGLSSDSVRSIYQDAEGDMWVGTLDGGVCQLRVGRFGVYTTQDGLPQDFALAVYEDAGGSLWVGTLGGLARFKDGSVTAYTTRDGLPENGGSSITEDRAGNLWANVRGKLARFRDGRFTVQPIENGQAFNHRVSAVLGDRAGNLWIATRGSGLNLYREGRFTLYTTRDGLADNDTLSLYEDRQGAIWVGTRTGGISRFKDGRFSTWTTKDGLANFHVLSFYEDRWGSMWIGTSEGGLSRFRDGKFSTISVKDGLYDNLAFQILSDTEDDSGYLWFSCNKGIYRVSLQDLNDFAEGRTRRVNSYAYGVADGMLSRECNGASPAGWKTRDGRLWFPTIKGVVMIDPRRHHTESPLVAIEQAVLDREVLPDRESVRIRPGQGNLEIHYTGLNWQRPQQIKFKYQLVGLDEDWVDAGTRRTAYYPHLPPGEYTFKVIADNGEGVWNMEGKSLRITVLPPFYRTWWFITLAAFSVAGLVGLAWKYRVAQLTRAQAAQQAFSRQLIESQEGERKRIAAELHDSLGQTLLIIKNRAFLGIRVTENGGSASPQLETANEQFDEISGAAAEAINEVRAIAYHLRPSQLERLGLTTSIEEMIEQVADASGIRFDCEIAPLDRVFSSESEINFYRIVQESLNNIVKHSDASEVSIRIRNEARGVELMIQDNGKGFEPNAARSNGPRKPGFGLTSIAERARILGGNHQIESVPGRGTTVLVKIETPKG
jgi:ligand-binding sensor domain-containing protein/signal transduction histidine kinase